MAMAIGMGDDQSDFDGAKRTLSLASVIGKFQSGGLT
jgi:hypothetical protein